MRRLVYRSRSNGDVDAADVAAITQTAQRLNPGRAVTGFLISYDDRFLQFIEGPPMSIENLMDDLAEDNRHSDIEVLYDRSGEDRWFSDWAMKPMVSFGGTPAIEELRAALPGRVGGPELLEMIEDCVAGKAP